MLVLSRKKKQSIIIGKDIQVVILEVSGETVKIGIEAPPEWEIYRTEIYGKLKEENTLSVTSVQEVLDLMTKKH